MVGNKFAKSCRKRWLGPQLCGQLLYTSQLRVIISFPTDHVKDNSTHVQHLVKDELRSEAIWYK
jgi:hypothetical protein